LNNGALKANIITQVKGWMMPGVLQDFQAETYAYKNGKNIFQTAIWHACHHATRLLQCLQVL
jgi:hypothetical protein